MLEVAWQHSPTKGVLYVEIIEFFDMLHVARTKRPGWGGGGGQNSRRVRKFTIPLAFAALLSIHRVILATVGLMWCVAVSNNGVINFGIMAEIIPIMPELGELPDAVRGLRDERWRKFAWAYVFGGGEGAAAARVAGYSDVKEAAKVRAHYLLQRDDIQEAIKALTGRYLFSLAPRAVLRLGELLDNPKHAKHTKAIEMVLDRSGHGPQSEVNVNLGGEVSVNRTDAALDALRMMKSWGVPRETLIGHFGFSGLARYERMLEEADRLGPKVIEGEVVK